VLLCLGIPDLLSCESPESSGIMVSLLKARERSVRGNETGNDENGADSEPHRVWQHLRDRARFPADDLRSAALRT